jgi:hypothetical protein
VAFREKQCGQLVMSHFINEQHFQPDVQPFSKSVRDLVLMSVRSVAHP